jgi:hypothetical protein
MWCLLRCFLSTKEIHQILLRSSYADYTKLAEDKHVLLGNLFAYCQNYPEEKISQNRFIHEYKEFPYRLEQNIDEVLDEL